jgi:hypothetical protein
MVQLFCIHALSDVSVNDGSEYDISAADYIEKRSQPNETDVKSFMKVTCYIHEHLIFGASRDTYR